MKAEKNLLAYQTCSISKIIRWNYYGKLYKSEMYPTLRHINKALIMLARKKYNRLACYKNRAEYFIGRITKQIPKLFKHWELGIKPKAGQQESDELRGTSGYERGF